MTYILDEPPFFSWGELKLMKGRGEGVGQDLNFRGCGWVRGDDLFQRDYSFYIKNKLRSEIFNDKRVLKTK